MPELRQIVKNMVDAGEDEAAIAAVIKRHGELNTPPDRTPEIPPAPFTGQTARSVGPEEPDTFWGGVGRSFSSGEVANAAWEGLKGWGEGAILDIPSTIKDTVHGLWEGGKSIIDDPEAHLKAMSPAFKEMGQQFADTVARAGSEPRAFGRMTGQITGQPLATEGAIAGAGMAGRAARLPVSRIMEPLGRAMEGSRAATAGVPYTKTGAIAKIAGRTIAPAGRVIRQTGENLRMAGRGVETANDFAGRGVPTRSRFQKVIDTISRKYTGDVAEQSPITPLPPDNPYTNIINGNRGYRGEADNIPPIVETPNDLAARGGGTQPSFPFEPFDAVDIDPIFRNPPKGPPPSGAAPKLVRDPDAPLTPEEMMASAIEEVRERFRKETDPRTEAPPPPFSLGAPAAPEQPRFSVKATRTTGKVNKPAKTAAETKNPPTEAKFEPSVDPKDLAGVDPVELKAALEKMKAKDAGVDPATGEVIPPKRAGVKWKNPFERLNNETGAIGRDISDIVQRQAAEKAARQGVERPTANMPDWGLETVRTPRPVNPLRPIVPEGQVTNRQMFENSDRVAAQNRPNPAQKFADEVLAGNEYSEDMLLTPDELRNPDVPAMENSPFENRFDPRIAPGGVVSEQAPSFGDIQNRMYELTDKGTDGTITAAELAEAQALNKQWRDHPEFNKPTEIKPEDWGDWGGAEKDLPTLVNDESGSTVAKPRSSFSDRVKRLWEDEAGELGSDVKPKRVPSVGDRSWDVMHPSGKPIGNLTVTRQEIAAARKGGHVPDGMDDVDVSNAMFDQKLKNMATENGYTVNDLHRLRINYNTKSAKEGKVTVNPTGDNPARKSTPIGPQGKSYRITSKDDEHLGDITITPEEVQTAIEAAAKEGVDLTPEQTHQIIYEDKVEDLLDSHGRDITEVGDVKGELMNANQKKVRNTAESKEPTVFKEDTPVIDPDKAFAKGGDIKPIIKEAERLARTEGGDLKFKGLLPKELRYALGEGETFKQRLDALLTALKEDTPEIGAQKLAERDAFLQSVKDAIGVENLPNVPALRTQDIGAPIRSKDLRITPEGRFIPRRRVR
jgi:hypothetical protein